MNRIVFHLDMDAFFASVEEREHPEFKGMPIVVGADPKEGEGRGVVSTANYRAREYGIGSAMPISKAWRLCQNGVKGGGEKCIFFGGGMKKYGEESKRIMDIVSKHVRVIERAGLDEAYFESEGFKEFPISKSKISKWEAAVATAGRIKGEIKDVTRLTASIGIGPNKLVAKIASDIQKPDGLTVVEPKNVESILSPLPLRRIPGIGPKAVELFSKRGATQVRDALRFSEGELVSLFGRSGSGIYQKLRGIDDRPLMGVRERKSLGHEMTFMNDENDFQILMDTLNRLSKKVADEVAESGLLARRITLRVRFGDFTTLTRQTTLTKPSDSVAIFKKETLKLFMPFMDSRENPKRKAFRLLGVRAGSMTAEQVLDV